MSRVAQWNEPPKRLKLRNGQGMGSKPHFLKRRMSSTSWGSTMTLFSSSMRMFMLIQELQRAKSDIEEGAGAVSTSQERKSSGIFVSRSELMRTFPGASG